MTVYPNLNILSGTAFDSYVPKIEKYLTIVKKDGGVNNKPYISASYSNPAPNSFTDMLVWRLEKERLEPSTTYTFSFYLKGKGTIETFVHPSLVDTSSNNSYADGKVMKPNTNGQYVWDLTNEWVRHTYTFTTKSSIGNEQYFLFRISTGNSVDICLPKVEEGSIATPWLPSFSEATASDYPSYIGTYTDNDSNAQSTDPVRYIWKKIE